MNSAVPVDASVRERRLLCRAGSSLINARGVFLPSPPHLGAISTRGGRQAASVLLAEVHRGLSSDFTSGCGIRGHSRLWV